VLSAAESRESQFFQYSAALCGETQYLDLRLQSRDCPMTANVAVDARRSGGVYKFCSLRIDSLELGHQVLGPPQSVFLVVVLSAPELGVWYDLRRSLLSAARLALFLCSLGETSLLTVVIEDHGAILARYGSTHWTVVIPEDFQQLTICDSSRVIVDLDGFAVIAESSVGRVALRPPGIADPSADDTGKTPELGVRSPESSHGEGGGLCVRWSCEINRGDGDSGVFWFRRRAHCCSLPRV